MKKRSRKKQKNKGLFLVAIAVLVVGIGFAALQKYLTIDGTASINSNFDVRFNGINTINTVGGAYNKTEPSYTDTTATFDAAFLAPGDSITYEILVQNVGTMNAKLESMDINVENNENISYEVTGIKSGDIIESFPYSDWGMGDMGNEEHPTQKVVNLKLTYSGTVSEITTSNVKVTMKFVQTNEKTELQTNAITLMESEKPAVSYDLYKAFSKIEEWGGSSTQYQLTFNYDYESENFEQLSNYFLGIEVYKNVYADVWEIAKNATEDFLITYNHCTMKLRCTYAINGVKYYSDYSDEFMLNYVEENGFIYEASDLNTIVKLNETYFADGILTLPVGKKIKGFAISRNITKVIIPENYDLSDLTSSSLHAVKMSDYNLNTVVNKTGNTIDWAPVLGYGGIYNTETHSYLKCQYETGLCLDVNIVAE